MFESLYTETCALFQPFFLLPIEPAANGIANANAEGGRKNQMAVTASFIGHCKYWEKASTLPSRFKKRGTII